MKKVVAGRRPKTSTRDAGTRMAILKAARTVFARRGFEGASTREVADAAGVNTAMIYYHFQDKVKLYRAVLAHSFIEFDRIWDDPAFSSRVSSRKKIQTYIEGFIRFQQANEEIRRIMSMEFASCSGNHKWIADHHFTHSYERLADLLREAMRSGDLKKMDPAPAISSLVGMVIHSFIMRPIAEHVIGRKLDLDVSRFGRFVTDLFFNGLQPSAKRSVSRKGTAL